VLFRSSASNCDIDDLKDWFVPKEIKYDLLQDLFRAGIDYRTIYPDLDGIAKGLWQSEIMKNGVDIQIRNISSDCSDF
jgi:hypothetical protein